MKNDALGDRMKSYEKAYTFGRSMPLIPTIARLDGKSFHNWTRGLDKPYDRDLTEIMQHVTKRLVEETNAVIGYTQSDEITLIYNTDSSASQIFFDGKLYKMTSVLASMCTAFFNDQRDIQVMHKCKTVEKQNLLSGKPLAFFDCRVFQTPTKGEAINCLVWREQDATRNSIQMAGHANFSHNQLHKKNCNEIQEMLFQEKGINWNNYEWFEKRGTYVMRKTINKALTFNEIEALPEKHHAREDPDMKVYRTAVEIIELPVLSSIRNREGVIFDGETPVLHDEDV